MSAIKRQEVVGMLLGTPSEAADMGPSSIPEEDHAASLYQHVVDQHVGYPDQVPFPSVTGIEGILDLLSLARGLVQYEFLSVISSVSLFCHENLPFRGLIEIPSISSLLNAGNRFSKKLTPIEQIGGCPVASIHRVA
jgi:hypothetical protein